MPTGDDGRCLACRWPTDRLGSPLTNINEGRPHLNWNQFANLCVCYLLLVRATDQASAISSNRGGLCEQANFVFSVRPRPALQLPPIECLRPAGIMSPICSQEHQSVGLKSVWSRSCKRHFTQVIVSRQYCGQVQLPACHTHTSTVLILASRDGLEVRGLEGRSRVKTFSISSINFKRSFTLVPLDQARNRMMAVVWQDP